MSKQNSIRRLLIVLGILAIVSRPTVVRASEMVTIEIGTTDLLETVQPVVGYQYDGAGGSLVGLRMERTR